jgi:hypothetical protein
MAQKYKYVLHISANQNLIWSATGHAYQYLLFCNIYQHSFLLRQVTGFTKLHMGLAVLVKKMSVLINFLLHNTNLVSILGKIYPNFAGHV